MSKNPKAKLHATAIVHANNLPHASAPAAGSSVHH